MSESGQNSGSGQSCTVASASVPYLNALDQKLSQYNFDHDQNSLQVLIALPRVAPSTVAAHGTLPFVAFYYESDSSRLSEVEQSNAPTDQGWAFTRYSQVLETEIGDTLVVLNLANGQYLALQGAIRVLWDTLFAGPCCEAAIVKNWQTRFANQADIVTYVSDAIALLVGHGLLVRTFCDVCQNRG